LSPQHATGPLALTAHVRLSPAAMSRAVFVPPSPKTGVGKKLLVKGPLPSCPFAFDPQQRMVPSASHAQVCMLPAAIATALPPSWLTEAGVSRGLVAVPSPI